MMRDGDEVVELRVRARLKCGKSYSIPLYGHRNNDIIPTILILTLTTTTWLIDYTNSKPASPLPKRAGTESGSALCTTA